jgi:hypothetical protein
MRVELADWLPSGSLERRLDRRQQLAIDAGKRWPRAQRLQISGIAPAREGCHGLSSPMRFNDFEGSLVSPCWPFRRDPARPDAGNSCTIRLAGPGQRRRHPASSAGRVRISRGYTNAEVVRHGCCAARPRGSGLLVSFRLWAAAGDCDLLGQCAIRGSVLSGCEIFCRNEQVGCGVFQRIRPLHGPEAVHPIRPHPRSGGLGQRLRHPASSTGRARISPHLTAPVKMAPPTWLSRAAS